MKNIFNVALPVLLIVFASPLFAQAVTGSMQCEGEYSSYTNLERSIKYSTHVSVVYSPIVQANTSMPITLQNLTLSCFRVNNPPESCPRTLSEFQGSVSVTAPVSLGSSYGYPGVNFDPPGSQFISTLAFSQVTYNSSVTENFTTPSQAGIYPIDGLCSVYGNTPEEAISLSYQVTAPASFQCNDSLNNDNAEGADTLDPQCHTDCNVNNAGSYVPTHNSETTPPNGTCPAAPTLQLNGRAAFLQGVKNFFASITAKAFAGE